MTVLANVSTTATDRASISISRPSPRSSVIRITVTEPTFLDGTSGIDRETILNWDLSVIDAYRLRRAIEEAIGQAIHDFRT